MSAARLLRLPPSAHEQGHSYLCQLPADLPPGDSVELPLASGLELFEDGRALGPAHAQHEDIRTLGQGRFSHWQGWLYFSTSDNTNPCRNGRSYDVYVPGAAGSRLTNLNKGHDRRSAGDSWDAYALAEALFYEVYPDAFLGEFGKACWKDEGFVNDYLRLVPGNRRSFERKYVVAQLVRAIRHVEGDLAECGVFNGATAYFMAQATAAVDVPRSLHLFDSFEGLSRPGPEDGQYWAVGALAMPEDIARRNLQEYEKVFFYRGWIPERFAEVADRQFAFVHIDVDLYQPTLDSLTFFYPRTKSGGMLLCDDYGFTTCPGATTAVREFLHDKPEEVIHLPTGQGLVIRA